MRRSKDIDYRTSLQRAMDSSDSKEIDATATRQENTVEALMDRLYDEDPAVRRELVLLADEVGLGKTFVALGVAWSVLSQRVAAGLPARPVLIVTPGAHALFRKWQREAETFFKDVLQVENPRSKVVAVETPHDLVSALRSNQSRIVIARMSAFSGRLTGYDRALAAVLHSLFRELEPELSVDQRLELVSEWSHMKSREAVHLKRSAHYFSLAESDPYIGFSEPQIRSALRRLKHVDPKLIERLQESFKRVAAGEEKRSGFLNDLRELARAALGQRINGKLPLVIVDEVHNWKNHPQSWYRFLHTVGGRFERLVGLSATPFQLGPHELSQVLALRRCLLLDRDRMNELEASAASLTGHMNHAQAAGKKLRESWAEVDEKDLPELSAAWQAHHATYPSTYPLSPHLAVVLENVKALKESHETLTASLRPFLVRHRRSVSHRRWWVGRNADLSSSQLSTQGSSMKWQPGLDVVGDAELVHYLMMRASHEQKGCKGATDLGADLGGSYAFFRENRLKSLEKHSLPSARPYLTLVDLATRGDSHEHPKVGVTATRAFNAWLHGDKTLIFCFNLKTVDSIHEAVSQRIADYEALTLSKAFGCSREELPKRLLNFQNRLYQYRQSMYLMFQDHPLAGENGRVPPGLAMLPNDLSELALRLAAEGPPTDRSRFDRRRVLAVAEQVLVERWQKEDEGFKWIKGVVGAWSDQESLQQVITWILAPDWQHHRRSLVEGVKHEWKEDLLPDEEEREILRGESRSDDVVAWETVLSGRAGRSVLAPYLPESDNPLPSILSCWHAKALHGLPHRHRSLATRMLRRMVRSPGFLARFLLDDPATGAALARDSDEADAKWTTLLHQRWVTPPTGGESAKNRFDAYLDSLRKVVDTRENFEAYEQASRNQEVVARITGRSDAKERDRHFVGFNTPLVPEVLIVTTVGQEGIDLHRECRHVIHHDLPWNPAMLEQRTGRVDRIGSKASRMAAGDHTQGHLEVVVPYIANTYDEHRFRVVHGRSRLFDVTMGGDCDMDIQNRTSDVMEEDQVVDDLFTEERAELVVPLPVEIAEALRINLEA